MPRLFPPCGGRVEIKYTSAPSLTRSMHVAMADLKLDHLYVVYPGGERFPLAERITVAGLDAMQSILEH